MVESSPLPRAYSYLRFSTPEQQKGDSYRRQMDMAAVYAERNGLLLDAELTFHDVGISGFRGQNVETGRLGYFLEAVRSGLVPQGSLLLVEQLDRISRLSARRALRVLEDILELGVSVVTLNDGRTYTAASLDTDQVNLLIAILTFMRANEESATKARRVKAAWENKRANIGTTPLTSKVPAWLKLNRSTGARELIAERAEVVRRIFEMTAEGWGQHRIAEQFNREGLATWGRSAHWHRSYIAKILASPAVVGTFAPGTVEYDGNKRRRTKLEPIEGYFPPAVPLELWKEVQALRSSERGVARGRHAHKPISNILAGLAVCPECGGTATRVNKGAKSVPSLVCAKAKAGAGCVYKSVRYELVEDAILNRLPARLKDTPAGGGTEEIDRELANVEAEADVLRDRIETTAGNLTARHSPALMSKLRELEDELDRLIEAREGLLERRTAASGPLVGQRVERLLASLREPLDREAANRAMRAVFDRVVIDHGHGELVCHWTHGGTCEVPFMSAFLPIEA